MKKPIVIIISLCVMLLFASCKTTHRVTYSPEYINSFEGKSHQTLIEQLGAPTKEFSDGADGYILVYEGNKELFKYSSEYGNKKSGSLPNAQFYMNSDGICQRVRVDNTDSVKVVSVGGTIVLVILLLLIL